MTIPPNEERQKLFDLILPWLDGRELRKDAPQEIVEAFKEHDRIFREQEELEFKLMNGELWKYFY